MTGREHQQANLPQPGVQLDGPVPITVPVVLQQSAEVWVVNTLSGSMQKTTVTDGTLLSLGHMIAGGQMMPPCRVTSPNQSQGTKSVYASVGIGHPPLGGPLHGLPPQVFATGFGDGHGFDGNFSASMSPQASSYYPYASFDPWVEACGGFLGGVHGSLEGKRLAGIGCGPMGSLLATMASRAGADVHMFEADKDMQGRTRTIKTPNGGLYEMGMMRFPRSSTRLAHLLAECGFALMPGFPNPGQCPNTLVNFENKTSDWFNTMKCAPGFEQVALDFEQFLQEGFDGLVGWLTIQQWLSNGNLDFAYKAEQNWLNRFNGKSIDQAMREIFAGKWDDEMYQRFDERGVGSGGFGVIKDHSFAMLFLLIVEGHEIKQCGIGRVTGEGAVRSCAGDFADKLGEFANTHAEVHLETKVTAVAYEDGEYTISTEQGGTFKSDLLVSAIPMPAMFEIDGLMECLGLQDVFASKEDMPAQMRSSKIFFEADVTDIPEVDEDDFAQCLLSGFTSPHMYFVRFETRAGRKYIQVLAFYGWQSVHDELADLSLNEAFARCKQSAMDVVEGHRFENAYRKIFERAENIERFDWQKDGFAGAAFTLAGPDDLANLREFAFQFQRSDARSDGAYAINSDGLAGGWIDDAIKSLLLVFSSMLQAHGQLNYAHIAPCNTVQKDVLRFD